MAHGLTKSEEKELDKLWSLAVRKRDKYTCQHCGKKSKYVQAAHIFRRGNLSTRWLLLNGQTLCSMCHIFSNHFSAHRTPVEFTEWIIEKMGSLEYQLLKKKSNTLYTKKVDYQLIKKQLI